jgi:mono/diheme cytochrome c family protein
MALRIAFAAALLFAGTFIGGCGGPSRTLSPAQRGEVLYRTNCASCHGSNPKQQGPIGPAIAGSPRELLEARVLHRSYPSGYHPKRSSHLMLSMPWMAGHIDDLKAYLDAAANNEQATTEERRELKSAKAR